jgi:tRNA dimethylallyltransferase
MTPPPIPLIVLLGPTATGKTRLGVSLAAQGNGEVISADSRQVYRGLNLGSGKDLQEYILAGRQIPHHLIDVADLGDEYTAFHFQRDCFLALAEIGSRGRLPFLIGGSGLYLEAVLLGYDLRPVPANPARQAELAQLSDEALKERLARFKGPLHNTTDTLERARLVRAVEIAEALAGHPPAPLPPLRALVLGVKVPRAQLRQRIRKRLLDRLQAGMLDEVRGLLARGIPAERLRRLGLEYRFATEHVLGTLPDYDTFVERLALAICDFAKRQETWFRRMEKKGVPIHWVPAEGEAEAAGIVQAWLASSAPKP